MHVFETIEDTRKQISEWKKAGFRIAFVPTMGNLHDGHLSLVRKARELADKVVVSIYVNPLQFGENEDLDAYPRTLDADKSKLCEYQTDALFLPSDQIMYVDGIKKGTQVSVPLIGDILCGEHRPGHFVGVATVVCKLLNVVMPDNAIFGEKDFQQVAVIRKMVKDLYMPVEVCSVSTSRESDGLAMSSRNQYLTATERETAPLLYKVLADAVQKIKNGDKFIGVQQSASNTLGNSGFRVEYFSLRSAGTLLEASANDSRLVLLVAAHLGKTRLIDNIPFQR